MANHRLRATAAVIAAVIVLAISAAPAAAQTPIRVENSKATLFQGSVTPVTGTLKDNTGASHTTSKSTALGALIAASRGANPFTLDLGWFDGLGGGWAGFYLAGVNGTTPAVQRLLGAEGQPEADIPWPRIADGGRQGQRAGLLHDHRPR